MSKWFFIFIDGEACFHYRYTLTTNELFVGRRGEMLNKLCTEAKRCFSNKAQSTVEHERCTFDKMLSLV